MMSLAQDQHTRPAETTVVLARPESPYRALAAEIAGLESIAMVDSLDAAMGLRPAFLLWVVSPAELSDRAVTSFNVALDRASSRPSTGLITGSSLERARDLYARAQGANGRRVAAVLGEDTFSPGQIVEQANGERRARPLGAAADVLELLKRVDYLHYAGHGGSNYWRLVANERVTSPGIPPLPPVVISTMSCQTTRVWEAGSIALRMIDQGAAAYSGFYFSPMAGYQIGEESGPFQHTWPDVPVGHVVEGMNAAARKAYANVSFHLLLGDPRIALRSEPPCRLLDHGETDGVRTLSCAAAPSGLIPVRVRGGARYGFVEIPGIATAWDRERSYNRRVQMATVGEDRILLVEHRGGDLHVTLRERPPVAWRATNSVLDTLDTWLVSMADRRHGGDIVALVFGAIATLVVARRVGRRNVDRVHLVPAALLGVTAAVLHGAYAVARQGDLAITSKPIVFSPLAAVGTGLLVACGAFSFLASQSWRGRLIGTVLATLAGWFGGTMALAMSLGASAAIASRTGIDVWIYRADFSPFVLSAVGCVACAVGFSLVRRFASRRPLQPFMVAH